MFDLEQRTICPTDRHVFWMLDSKTGVTTGDQQLAAAQRKAAIADIISIMELWPWRPDVVVPKEGLIPLSGIDHEPVPLRDQAVRRVDVIDQIAQEEFRIGPRGAKPLNAYHSDPVIDLSELLVSKEQAFGELNLIKTGAQRRHGRANIDRGRGTKSDGWQLENSHSRRQLQTVH